ncbi:MAG: hypothetical protein DLM62_11685, partial [Pseudonocardiales bacterium]
TSGANHLVIGVAVVLTVAFLVPDRKGPEEQVIELASDYPVPPLDVAVPTRPRHQLRRRREDVVAGVGTDRGPSMVRPGDAG